MRGSRAFDAYVRVCESGTPWLHEVNYDTPFGDGYILGTFVERAAKLGDGLVNFLTDVTAQRRMEGELRSSADVVAHDLNEPIAGIGLLVRLLERRAAEPPSADVLRQLRLSTDRARDLTEGCSSIARRRAAHPAGRARTADGRGGRGHPGEPRGRGGTLEVGELPELEVDPRQCGACCRTCLGTR